MIYEMEVLVFKGSGKFLETIQDFYSLFDNDCEYELSITDNLLDATTFRSIDQAFEIRELVCENPHDWEIVLFGGGS